MSASPAASIPEVSHHLASINGTELHYVSAGTQGSPALLVHGFPETWWAFHRVIAPLADTHRVFAVDLRGFGDSSNQGDEFGSATAADDLRLLIEHLDVGPVHLTGQDVSGAPTFRLAATHPDSVKSYTAIETALPGFGGERLADITSGGAWYIGALTAPGVPESLFAGRERELIGELVYPAYGASVDDADIDEFVRTYARPGGLRGATGLFRSLLEDGDELQAVAGRGPLVPPAMTIGTMAGEFVHAAISQAAGTEVRSVLLEGVGHYAALDAPDQVVAALLDFFAIVDGD